MSAREKERPRTGKKSAKGGKERKRETRTTHHTLYCPINSNLLPVAEKDKEGRACTR